jgi:hypothetical protein
VKNLKLVQLFSDPGKFDRTTGDSAKRKSRPASGIAIEFGENDAGEAESFVEALGDAYSLLACSSITDDEDFLRLQKIPEVFEFLDEGFIQLLATGRIENLDIATCGIAPVQRLPGDLENISLAFLWAENGDVDLLSQHGQLIDGGWAVKVAGDEEW